MKPAVAKMVAKKLVKTVVKIVVSFKPTSNGGPGGHDAKEKAGALGASLLKEMHSKKCVRNAAEKLSSSVNLIGNKDVELVRDDNDVFLKANRGREGFFSNNERQPNRRKGCDKKA